MRSGGETERRDGAENERYAEVELKDYFIIVNGYWFKNILNYKCTYVLTLQLDLH